jgi:endonuclease G, mitochondrial
VLGPADEVFVGTAGNRTPLRAKIPARFWKIIVAQSDDGLAAFGFVLEQDLADVPLEFTVPRESCRR